MAPSRVITPVTTKLRSAIGDMRERASAIIRPTNLGTWPGCLVVIVYSSTMIGICHQLLRCDQSLEAVKHSAEQVIIIRRAVQLVRSHDNSRTLPLLLA